MDKTAVTPARQSRDDLILAHLHLVEPIARAVMGIFTHHVDFDELVACGRLGLVKAAAAYRCERGDFKHFSWFYIRGAMIDANRRSAYREDTHDSVEGMQERLGFLPARVATCQQPLPDEIAARREKARTVASAIAELPSDQRAVLVDALQGGDLSRTAASCGRSLSWARVRLRLARETVAAAVQEKAA